MACFDQYVFEQCCSPPPALESCHAEVVGSAFRRRASELVSAGGGHVSRAECFLVCLLPLVAFRCNVQVTIPAEQARCASDTAQISWTLRRAGPGLVNGGYRCAKQRLGMVLAFRKLLMFFPRKL